jgi:hypothetical protein
MAGTWFALGWAISSTLNYSQDLSHIVSPLGILLTAFTGIYIAYTGWEKSKKSKAVDRTITYLLEIFPMSADNVSVLGTAQEKLMKSVSSFAVIDENNLNFYLNIYEEETSNLSDEEIASLENIIGIHEAICINVKHGYFDESVVKEHLGEDFGVSIWIRSWPYIVYKNELEKLHMNMKGIVLEEKFGVYSAYIERMKRSPKLTTRYPRYGEKTANQIKVKVSDPMNIIKLPLS